MEENNFQILIGGKPPENKIPIDEVDRQIKSNNVLMEKWESCKWRSNKEKTILKSCCGRKEEIECYNCYKLNIQQLTPIICSRCNVFEKKDNE